MTNKKMFAIFPGEFGWEVMGWQGWLRNISSEYDYIVVATRPGREGLYTDFADEIISFDFCSNEANMWFCRGVNTKGEQKKYIDIQENYLKIGYEVFEPCEIYKEHYLTLQNNCPKQKIIEYGKYNEKLVYDLVFHARSTEKTNSGNKNWSLENWGIVMRYFKIQGLTIASVGSVDGAYYILGIEDKRGINLLELANLLRSSRLLIGPSSGIMHFGALCGIKQLVWSGNAYVKNRHIKYWNPFNYPVEMIVSDKNYWIKGKYWQPTVSEVIEKIRGILR